VAAAAAADGISSVGVGTLSVRRYQLPQPSDEQIAVVEALVEGKNVKVDAVAGSGKTTAVLLSASKLASKRFLLLTYNARLKFESRSKAKAMSLNNIEVHTFHSMGHMYYAKCANDDDMRRLLRVNIHYSRLFRYDIIIIDEAQDMTPLHCKFVHKLFADNREENSQLMVIGDNRQCIYEYLGADERHLVLANAGVFYSGREWKSLSLKTSYRNTGNIVSFVNDACLGIQR
jgi:superfamily I DNA/RNA helicase